MLVSLCVWARCGVVESFYLFTISLAVNGCSSGGLMHSGLSSYMETSTLGESALKKWFISSCGTVHDALLSAAAAIGLFVVDFSTYDPQLGPCCVMNNVIR